MNGNGRHYTLSELNALFESRLEPDTAAETDPHLVLCNRCLQRYLDLKRIDRSLRSIPVPETGREFTRSLMRELSRRSRSPLTFRVLEHGASFLGTLAVLAFLVATCLLVNLPPGIEDASSPLRIIARGWSVASGWIAVGGQWLAGHLAPREGLGPYQVWLGGAAAVLALVVLDRILARRFFQKAP
jgi:anti-sigma factor RsiW